MVQLDIIRRGRFSRYVLFPCLIVLSTIGLRSILYDVIDDRQEKPKNTRILLDPIDSYTLMRLFQDDAPLHMIDPKDRKNPNQNIYNLPYFSFYDARTPAVLDNRPHTRGMVTRKPTPDEETWFKQVQDRAAAAVEDRNVKGQNCMDIRYRHIQQIGVELEVTCYTQDNTISISMLEHVGPTVVVGPPRAAPNTTLHLALALSGRPQVLKMFLSNLNAVIKKRPQSMVLTITYFVDNNTQEVYKIVSDAQDASSNLTVNIKLLNQAFSRGGGLLTSLKTMKAIGSKDMIVWLCDVDMAFTEDFIDRCRSTPIPEKQVFMPIVFSQYNQSLQSQMMGSAPKKTSKEAIPVPKDDEGYWRLFGHGNVCAYRSDLLAVGAFSVDRTTWGGEDIELLEKFDKRRTYRIIRSIEPALVHRFHPKNCDGIVGRYLWSCMKIQASNEASQFTFGIMHFSKTNKNSNTTKSLYLI